MGKSLLMAVMVTALFAAPAAWAGVGKGDLEAGASISVTHTETSVAGTTTKSDNGNVGAGVGYFFTDMLEGKLNLSGTSASTAGSTLTYGTINPGLDVVFLTRKGKACPFVGASYALSWGDKVGPVDSDYYEGHVGVKVFFREKASVEAKLARYEATDSKATNSHTELAVGLNVYF